MCPENVPGGRRYTRSARGRPMRDLRPPSAQGYSSPPSAPPLAFGGPEVAERALSSTSPSRPVRASDRAAPVDGPPAPHRRLTRTMSLAVASVQALDLRRRDKWSALPDRSGSAGSWVRWSAWSWPCQARRTRSAVERPAVPRLTRTRPGATSARSLLVDLDDQRRAGGVDSRSPPQGGARSPSAATACCPAPSWGGQSPGRR